MTRPELSVIFPLGDPRGDPLAHVRSWTHGQDHPRDRFQVVAASDGADPGLERRVEELLRPHDHLVRLPGQTDWALYREGARRAEGRVLLFTENHTVADPRCASEVLRHLDAHPRLAGASLRSAHLNRNRLARLEQRYYEELSAIWPARAPWNRVRLRGFAIRRDVFLEVGGFEPRYGLFAEVALAAALDARGHEVGEAPDALITHVNVEDFPFLRSHIASYARGECAYRAEHDPAHCERYFGLPEEWSGRRAWRRDVQRLIVGALGTLAARRLAGGGGGVWTRRLTAELLRQLPGALVGPHWDLLAARLARRWTELRTHLAPRDRASLPAYRAAWEGTVRVTRLEWLLAHPPASDPLPSLPLGVRVEDLPEPGRVGFHSRESWGGRPFRWAAPTALLGVSVPPCDLRFTLDTGGLRGDPRHYLAGLFWNGHLVPPRSIRVEGGRVTFPLLRRWMDSAGTQWLLVVSDPVPRRRDGPPDPRRLGFPFFAVEAAIDEPSPVTPTAGGPGR